MIDQALDTAACTLYNVRWMYKPARIVVDSCYKRYSDLIINRTEAFLEQYRDESIPVKVQIVKAQYDEYHMMRGCFKQVLEKWIEGLVTGPQ